MSRDRFHKDDERPATRALRPSSSPTAVKSPCTPPSCSAWTQPPFPTSVTTGTVRGRAASPWLGTTMLISSTQLPAFCAFPMGERASSWPPAVHGKAAAQDSAPLLSAEAGSRHACIFTQLVLARLTPTRFPTVRMLLRGVREGSHGTVPTHPRPEEPWRSPTRASGLHHARPAANNQNSHLMAITPAQPSEAKRRG